MCTEPMTRSSFASTVSSKSSEPSGRMSTSLAQSVRIPCRSPSVFDKCALFEQLARIEAEAAPAPVRVVADRMILVTARRGGSDHRVKAVVAVAPDGVHVEIAAKVVGFDEIGDRAVASELDLVESAAQFRRNVLHAQRGVDAGFLRARYHLAVLEV